MCFLPSHLEYISGIKHYKVSSCYEVELNSPLPIANLKSLNRFVEYQYFKMEGIHVLKDTVRPLDFFTKIDLKDAYVTVPILVEHKKFLQFRWDGVLNQFTCLFFASPRPLGRLLSC